MAGTLRLGGQLGTNLKSWGSRLWLMKWKEPVNYLSLDASRLVHSTPFEHPDGKGDKLLLFLVLLPALSLREIPIVTKKQGL